jgi:hypothetical protein
LIIYWELGLLISIYMLRTCLKKKLL